jgi:glycine oxidase
LDDVLIIGGGVIGLSLAYELAQHGARVRVIDRGPLGSESSWAGAGILPPGARHPQAHPLEQLAALSAELHAHWAEQLRAETGIDTGYRRCGGLYLPEGPDSQALDDAMEALRRGGVEVQALSRAELRREEPALRCGELQRAWLLPQEAQVRNPRHLKALAAACAQRGVTLGAGVSADDLVVRGGRIDAVRTCQGELRAAQYCLCSGAWSGALAQRCGTWVRVKPVRGQIVLLASVPAVLRRVVNCGARYLVPRPDGYTLVGSTEEDVGFDKRTTASAVEQLLHFAQHWVPALGSAAVQRCWSGLRPGTPDGLPYLGPLPELHNGFVACGHFRSGLLLSTGTARVMAQVLRGEPPEVDLSAFRPERHAASAVQT